MKSRKVTSWDFARISFHKAKQGIVTNFSFFLLMKFSLKSIFDEWPENVRS